MCAALDPKKSSMEGPLSRAKGSCLMSSLRHKEMIALQDSMKQEKWLTNNISFYKLIGDKDAYYKLYCKSERLRYLAWLLHELYREQFISVDHGKGYMKMAAKHILSDGMPVTEAQLNKLCTEVQSNQRKYADVIAIVNTIIATIKSAGA